MTICERPILFSGDMVKAILDGRKTQTRRVIKNAPIELLSRPEILPSLIEAYKTAWIKTCPYGQVGDLLWVRETWGAWPYMGGGIQQDSLRYRADGEYQDEHRAWRWRPSIHMPRWVSRITLEITGVRVERVQDITAADAEAEGFVSVSYKNAPKGSIGFPAQVAVARIAIGQFVKYWDSINAKRGYDWTTNLFVWVISFRRVK